MILSRPQKGFTLIEIAVGMVIIALILGGIISLYSRQSLVNQVRTTRVQLETIKQAIIGYALTQRRLPCPDTDGDGVQDTQPAFGVNCQNTGGANIYEGAVPYVTLGLPANDAWGYPVRYVISGRAAGDNFNDDPNGASASFDFSSVGDIQITDYNGNILVNDAPLALISHGKNGGIAWNAPCTAANVPDNSERENCDNDRVLVSSSYRGSDANPVFDDIVDWIPLPVLKSKMLEGGVLP